MKTSATPGVIIIIALAAVVLGLAACGGSSRPGVTEGVSGEVIFWEGDFMPGPGGTSGTKTPVAREIYIHKETTLGMVVQDAFGPFYTAVNSELVAVTCSDADGSFHAALSPGTYSLFVKEGDLYYANRFSGGLIMPVTVEAGAVTRVTIDIDYMATF